MITDETSQISIKLDLHPKEFISETKEPLRNKMNSMLRLQINTAHRAKCSQDTLVMARQSRCSNQYIMQSKY
jgi:hypothetical protein